MAENAHNISVPSRRLLMALPLVAALPKPARAALSREEKIVYLAFLQHEVRALLREILPDAGLLPEMWVPPLPQGLPPGAPSLRADAVMRAAGVL